MAAALRAIRTRGLIRWGRHLSSDGKDPTPPDFASMMNQLSAKSAAAVESKRGKDPRLPPAQRAPISAPAAAHGRLDEVQLQQLLGMQRDGADRAEVLAAARTLGVKDGDPALASALEELRAPVVLIDHLGNKTGLWAKPQLGEFGAGS